LKHIWHCDVSPGPRATHPPPFYIWGLDKGTILRASPPTFSMWPCKHFSHIQVLVPNFFPTPPRKLNPGGQGGGRLQITTHLDQSNYLANQKQGAVNKYNLIVFCRLFQGSESCLFFQSFPVDSLDLIDEPHPRLRVQGVTYWALVEML